jgi:hypothetical protein
MARLSRAAVVLGLLVVPAVLAGLARGASGGGGYDYGAAWSALLARRRAAAEAGATTSDPGDLVQAS